jgi:GNAT superfamily N-acetyltransferase
MDGNQRTAEHGAEEAEAPKKSSVRPARPGDAAAVAEVQLRTWREVYAGILPAAVLRSLTVEEAEQRWRAAVEDPPSDRHRLLVAVDEDRVVGFSAFGPAGDEDTDPATTGEIATLLVGPDAQRAGHGSRLLAATIDHVRAAGARAATTWIFDADGGMEAFYESAGWALDGASRDLDMGQLVHQVRLHTALTAPE